MAWKVCQQSNKIAGEFIASTNWLIFNSENDLWLFIINTASALLNPSSIEHVLIFKNSNSFAGTTGSKPNIFFAPLLINWLRKKSFEMRCSQEKHLLRFRTSENPENFDHECVKFGFLTRMTEYKKNHCDDAKFFSIHGLFTLSLWVGNVTDQ